MESNIHSNKSNYNPRLDIAKKCFEQGINVVPLKAKEKVPLDGFNLDRYFTVRNTQDEIDRWFTDTDHNLGMIMGKVSKTLALDFDGLAADEYFETKVSVKLSQDLKDNILSKTMAQKTGSGGMHVLVRYDPAEFSETDGIIKSKQLWTGNDKHSEIRLKGEGGYIVGPSSIHPSGNPYVSNGKDIVTLSRPQILDLLTAIDPKFRLVKDITAEDGPVDLPIGTIELTDEQIEQYAQIIIPYYHEGVRRDMMLGVSGQLYKHDITYASAEKIVVKICDTTGDNEKGARLGILRTTYQNINRKNPQTEIAGSEQIKDIICRQLQDSKIRPDIIAEGKIGRLLSILNKAKAKTQVKKLEQQLEQNKDNKTEVQRIKDELKAAKKAENDEKDPETIIRDATTDVLDTFYIFTTKDTDEMYVYKDGVYRPLAEKEILAYLEKAYGFSISIGIAAEVLAHVRWNTYIDRSQIDADPYIINMKNGLYNWLEDKFTPPNPRYFSVNQIPVKYDPKAKGPIQFMQFLRQVLYKHEIETALQMMAYTFLKDNPDELITILVGVGSNGKSVFTGVLEALHGSHNVSSVTMKQLIERPFSLAELYGKSINIDPELTSTTIKDTATLKRLTGRHLITAEKKGKQPFQFRNYAKFFFNANKVPLSADDSDGWYRRNIILSFPNQFDSENADSTLRYKLTTDEELSGIFNVLMIFLRRIHKQGIKLSDKTIAERRSKYMLVANPVQAFLDEACDKDARMNNEEPIEDIYRAFLLFAEEKKIAKMGKEQFGRTLTQILKDGVCMGSNPRRYAGTGNNRYYVYKGVKLTDAYKVKIAAVR